MQLTAKGKKHWRIVAPQERNYCGIHPLHKADGWLEHGQTCVVNIHTGSMCCLDCAAKLGVVKQ